MARTKTTTRDQTWNKHDNYVLKMFIWHLYKKLQNIELLAAYVYIRLIETQFVVKKLRKSDLKFVQF